MLGLLPQPQRLAAVVLAALCMIGAGPIVAPYQQPTPRFGTPIDFSSSLSRQLVSIYSMAEQGPSSVIFNVLQPALNRGTLSGTTIPTHRRWMFGSALFFDGTSSYVSLGTAPTISGEQTVAAWVNTTTVAVGAREIYADSDGLTLIQMAVLINNTAGKVTVQWDNATILTGTFSLAANTWYHIVGVRRGSSGAWTALDYVNGVLDASATTTTNPSAPQASAIGRDGGAASFFWSGLITDVRIWSRALTAAEIKQLYVGGPGAGFVTRFP